MAARLERARGALAALEAALAVEEEEGDVPTLVLVEHQMDTRRKQKLLLSQLRVLKLLLGVIENPGLPLAPSDLREAAAQARGRWRELKASYGGALGVLGEAVPPTLTQLERGRQLLQRGRAALGARLEQQEELQVKLREATERRDQLLRRVQERRLQRLERRGGATGTEGGGGQGGGLVSPVPGPGGGPGAAPLPRDPRAGAGAGAGTPPRLPPFPAPPPPAPVPRGGGPTAGTPLGLPPPLGPGLLELQQRCWGGWSLWAEVTHLRNRFALDWQPELGLLQVLGGPQGSQTLWTLELEPGYPQNGGVRLLPPPKGAPPIPAPPDPPTLTRWLELLVGGGAP